MSRHSTTKKVRVISGVSDTWGIELTYYHPDRAVVIQFVRWFLVIEKNYPYEQNLIYSTY